MRTYDIIPAPFGHPILLAARAKHHVYNQAALIIEGIERFGSGCPSPKHKFYPNAQAFYLQDGMTAGGRGIVHDAGGVMIRLNPATLERR